MKSLVFLLWLFTTLSLTNHKAYAETNDWTVTDINGKNYKLNKILEDDKKVMLFFSATWCSMSWEVIERKVLIVFIIPMD